MSGTKGRSGRKALPVALHLARGTYRPDRHGPRPATAGALALKVVVPPMPRALATGLADRGRQLVADLWVQYKDWQPEKLLVLHEAGAVADTLAEYESLLSKVSKTVATPSGREEAHPLLRLQAQAQRTLVLLLKQLDLRED